MGSDQQFCLRWNNFQSSLLASLPQLLDADDLTDVTLSAGGRNIRAHRVVLSACSQYFKDLFREMQSFQHPVIVLPQTTFSDLCSLVTFMYSGEVNIYQDQLAGLLSTADVLHIRGLAEVPHANGTPLKRKVEENVHQDPATSSHILQKRKISELPPSMTVNETPAHNPMGKLNRIEKPGKPLMGKKRSMERDEMEDLEQPPFVQVKVEQCVEAEVESPVQHTRPKPYLHHHSAPTLHAVQPMPPEKQCHAPRGGDSYALPHPVEDAIGMEGEAGYPEGNQVPVSTDAALQGQSSSEDSGGGGNGSGGGNAIELEHQNLGQGMIILPSNQIPSSRQSVNCPVCGRLISQRRNLKQHMRTHANQMDVPADRNKSMVWLGDTPMTRPLSGQQLYPPSKNNELVGQPQNPSPRRAWFVPESGKRDYPESGASSVINKDGGVSSSMLLLSNMIRVEAEDPDSDRCNVPDNCWIGSEKQVESEERNASNPLLPEEWYLQRDASSADKI